MFSERQRHIHQLNARHSTTVSQLTKSLSDLNGKNTNLKADALHWESVAHQALDDNRALLQQLEQKSAVLLELEAQVQVTEAQAGDSLDFRGSLSSLNHELALWQERSKREGSQYTAEMDEFQRQVHAQEAVIATLNEQLHTLHAKHHTLQTLYEEIKERAERADQERKDKGNLAHTQKQLLEYHKQVSVQKLRAVEAKYAALKKTYLGLERHLVMLEAEAEKYRLLRHQLGLAPAPSPSSVVPATAIVEPTSSSGETRLPPGRARSSTWHSLHPAEAAVAAPTLLPNLHSASMAVPEQPHALEGEYHQVGAASAGSTLLLSSSAPHDHGPLRP
jgi:hypothetical protein